MIALAGEDRLLSVSNSEGDTFKQVLHVNVNTGAVMFCNAKNINKYSH